MKRFLVPLVACLLAVSALAATPTNPSGFVIRRGTNLSHWLSQDFGWQPRSQWITEADFRFIAEAGFDHVRLPIDEKELWLENGRPNEEAFALLLRGIGWARSHGLRVIVDLHTVRTHHFNAENEGGHNTLFSDPKAQAAFLDLWRQLSARLHDQPVNAVAYEIMNEPVAENHEDWNRLVATAHAAIRALEPSRVLIIGSNRWQGPYTMPFLKVPAGDPNIILSTHTYSPFVLTHYTADWVPLKAYKGKVRYPGPVVTEQEFSLLQQLNAKGDLTGIISSARDNWGPARIAQEFAPAVQRARELGLQLYCGEFGCLPSVPRADRLAYYRDIVGVMEEAGMAWANWEYKGDFGLFEWRSPQQTDWKPDRELLGALLPDAKP